MYNKEMYQKVLSATCDFEELSDFESAIMAQVEEIDLDNSFEKYYSFNTIVSIIDKFKAGEITRDYLAVWANVYNWLITATLNDRFIEKKEKYNFQEYIEFEISDVLDNITSLQEPDEDEEEGEDIFTYLDDMIEECKRYDMIYKSYEDLNVYCKSTSISNSENLHFLGINQKNKTFFVFNEVNVCVPNVAVDDNCEKHLTAQEFYQKVDALKKSGFQQI